MMRRSCLLLLLVAALHVCHAEEENEECKRPQADWSLSGAWNMASGVASALFSSIEEVPYTVIDTRNTDDTDYEVREYPSKKWACTTEEVEGYNIEKEGASEKMFMRLFSYITGRNQKEMTIEMTVPVSTHFVKTTTDNNKVHMCFFIPEEHQDSPPEPTCPKVNIMVVPKRQVVTIERGGYPDEDEWKQMYTDLAARSKEFNDTGYDERNFYTAGYDAPFKFYNRRNEMWFSKNM